jgi:hypothetical protein
MIRQYSIILLIFCFAQAACSNSETDSECLTSDSVAVIDTLSTGNQILFLVHRISGWHEKIESFEVYDSQPVFNSCGETSSRPLFGASIDNQDADNNDQHVSHIYFKPPNEFDLYYEPGPPPNTSYYENITLELGNVQ